MAGFMKCPRCELNWIREGDGYCDICKSELKIGPQIDVDLDFGDEDDEKLCPICKRNYIKFDEDMCEQCREEAEEYIEPDNTDIDMDNDEEWRNYLDDDEKEAISNKDENGDEISLSEIAEEEGLFDDEEDDEEDEEEYYYDDKNKKDDDDFEIPEIDMRDFEEEDEEEDEEDDEEEGEEF